MQSRLNLDGFLPIHARRAAPVQRAVIRAALKDEEAVWGGTYGKSAEFRPRRVVKLAHHPVHLDRQGVLSDRTRRAGPGGACALA